MVVAEEGVEEMGESGPGLQLPVIRPVSSRICNVLYVNIVS